MATAEELTAGREALQRALQAHTDAVVAHKRAIMIKARLRPKPASARHEYTGGYGYLSQSEYEDRIEDYHRSVRKMPPRTRRLGKPSAWASARSPARSRPSATRRRRG